MFKVGNDMTIKWGNKMFLCSQECVLNSKVIYHFLSSPCCDIFPGDVWTSASRSHSGPPPQVGQRWTDAARRLKEAETFKQAQVSQQHLK